MSIQDYSADTRREHAPSKEREPGPTVSEAAERTTQRLRGEASKVASQAQEKASAFIAGQKTAAADHLQGLSQPLHEAVDRLREKSPGLISDYAQRAVDGLDSVATVLRDQDPRSIVRAVEGFARRQPALFVAGSVAAGFALARFLKSSSPGPESEGGRASASEYQPAHETPVEKDPQ